MFNRSPIADPDLRSLYPARSRLTAGLLLAGIFLSLGGFLVHDGLTVPGLFAAGTTVLVAATLTALRGSMARTRRDAVVQALSRFIEQDAAPSFVVDDEGQVVACNPAAATRYTDTKSDTLAGTLRATVANPSALLFRLQTRADQDGMAAEDVTSRRSHIRVAVQKLAKTRYLWRVEEGNVRSGAGHAMDQVPIPMITVARSGTLLYMNEAARSMIGKRVTALDRLFESLPVRAGEVNQAMTASGRMDVYVSEATASLGRREMFLLPFHGVTGSSSDGIFDTLPVAMIKLSTSGCIQKANRLANELLGLSDPADMELGQVMNGLGRPVPDWLRDTLNGDVAPHSEFLRLTRTDREVFVQATLSRATEDGKTVLIAALNDATELKTLEAQFVQSQKMQAIGQLAGGVAHDFNNLLTAISGHCDLLLLRHDQGDPDYGDLVQINQNSNRAAALVSQLLAFSRKQTLRPEVLDLRDTLSDLTHLLNRLVGEKVMLTLSHDPVLRPVRADKRQLEQVLMNLVVNARDAMPSGGEIRIDTEVVSLAATLNRDRASVPPGDYVTVRVTDEGIGIAADKLQKVFEPFYTTKRTGEGTGLGLSTAYGIIKQTGGFIFVDSVPGSGTTFTLYFPIHDEKLPEPAPRQQVPAPTVARQGEGVVLLVEDEAPVRAFAARALRLRGYTVLEADSAEEALRTLDDPELSVDVFVTDVVMPGMDGPSWVKQALKVRPGVRVVFVSGYAEGAFGESQPMVPNSVFLPKPFSLNTLTETVHQQFH